MVDTELVDKFLDWGVLLDLDVGDLNGRLLWDEIHLSLSFFFLELEGDTSDWSSLDSLHEVTGITYMIDKMLEFEKYKSGNADEGVVIAHKSFFYGRNGVFGRKS